jgi:nucleoside-diphosphate-sugar epimerase
MQPSKRPVIVVTGAAGLIGSRLIEALATRFTVVGIDVNEPRQLPNGVGFIPCDLTDDVSVAESLEELEKRYGNSVASVIHLAAYYDFSGKPSPLYQDLTIDGTRRLLRGLQHFDVEQFVFSSSLLVMVPAEEGERLTEDSPTDAEWDYPESKLAAEDIIAEEHGEIPVVILRIAGVYDEDCHSIPIAQQIRRIYERTFESHFFPGDQGHGQAFAHLDDLVDCFLKTIDRRRTSNPYEILLIGEEDVMSYHELQDHIGQLIHGKAWPTIRIPKTVAKVGAWVQEHLSTSDREPFIKPWMIELADQDYHLNISKAREILGWQPRHSLRDTLPEMISRLKENPLIWYEINGLQLPAACHSA